MGVVGCSRTATKRRLGHFSPGCPQRGLARDRLQTALRLAGLPDHAVAECEVVSLEETRRLRMHGSPTIRVGGRDAFPTTGEPSLSCRRFVEPEGLADVPSVEALVALLRS